MGLPRIFSNGHRKQQELKNRVLKNREGVLDIMAENIKGAKSCPFLMGQKCIGMMCEHFSEYGSTNLETGAQTTYYRCDHKQTPQLLIELNSNIMNLVKALNKTNA